MALVAAIRPDDWNWLLLVHLVGAFAAVGGLLAVAFVSLAAGRSHDFAESLYRLAFRTQLLVVVPGLVVLYVFGIVLADREYGDAEPAWLDAALRITDVTVVVGGALLAVLQHWVLRRIRTGSRGGWPAATANLVPLLALAALGVVIFLMSAKP